MALISLAIDKNSSGKIIDYLEYQSRNKIIFYSRDMPDLESVNIGLQISESIYNFKDLDRVGLRVSSVLNEILSESISDHAVFGKYLSIENLGILFEPSLKIELERLLDSFSQNNLLFVKWDGQIDTENIYFLTKEKGIKTSIKNLSHIVI